MSNPYQPQQPQWGQPQQPGPYGQPPQQQPQWGGQPTPPPGYPQPGMGTPPPGYPQQGPGGPGGPGMPGPYGQPGQPGQPPQQKPKGDGSAKKPLLFGLVGLVLIGVVFGVLAFLGVFTTKVLDTKAVQQGVQKVLTENFGMAKITSVSCPSSPEIKQGNTFTCTVTADGKQRQVPVKVTNDQGEYEVGQPK